MGIEIGKLKPAPCECFKLDGELLCHREGVIGFLSDEQEQRLCSVKHIEKAPEGLKRRHEQFAEIAHRCSEKVRKEYPKGKRLIPYLTCISEESKKVGLEI